MNSISEHISYKRRPSKKLKVGDLCWINWDKDLFLATISYCKENSTHDISVYWKQGVSPYSDMPWHRLKKARPKEILLWMFEGNENYYERYKHSSNNE